MATEVPREKGANANPPLPSSLVVSPWASSSHAPCLHTCTCPLLNGPSCTETTVLQRLLVSVEVGPLGKPVAHQGAQRAVSQQGSRLGTGPVVATFRIHPVKTLLRNMGTPHPLGVTALHSCACCRISGPSSEWVHACMELRSGAVFPPQLLAALWIRLLGDLRDCGAYAGRGLKCVSD